MTEFFPIFLVSLLWVGIPSAGIAYVTTVPCRLLVSRRRQPGWYIAFVVAVFLGTLAVLLLGGADLFHPSRWDAGKVSLREWVFPCFAAAAVGAFLPAWYVVGHYRARTPNN